MDKEKQKDKPGANFPERISRRPGLPIDGLRNAAAPYVVSIELEMYKRRRTGKVYVHYCASLVATYANGQQIEIVRYGSLVPDEALRQLAANFDKGLANYSKRLAETP